MQLFSTAQRRALNWSIAAAAALYLALIIISEPANFGANLRQVSGSAWALLLLLAITAISLRFSRWHWYLHALGHSVPLAANASIYLAGLALTTTPAKSGELIRSAYLLRYQVPLPTSIGVFISERFIDLCVVSLLACMAIAGFSQYQQWMLLSLLFLAVIALLLRSTLLQKVLPLLPLCGLRAYASDIHHTIRQLLQGRTLAGGGVLGSCAWLSQCLILLLLCRQLGYDTPWTMVCGVYALAVLIGVLSMIPGGLGATEAAIVGLLLAQGLQLDDASFVAIVCRASTLWLTIALGVLGLIQQGRVPQQPS